MLHIIIMEYGFSILSFIPISFLRKILREEDYVRLMQYTFHDYMHRHEEGTVFELSWEYV